MLRAGAQHGVLPPSSGKPADRSIPSASKWQHRPFKIEYSPGKGRPFLLWIEQPAFHPGVAVLIWPVGRTMLRYVSEQVSSFDVRPPARAARRALSPISCCARGPRIAGIRSGASGCRVWASSAHLLPCSLIGSGSPAAAPQLRPCRAMASAAPVQDKGNRQALCVSQRVSYSFVYVVRVLIRLFKRVFSMYFPTVC